MDNLVFFFLLLLLLEEEEAEGTAVERAVTGPLDSVVGLALDGETELDEEKSPAVLGDALMDAIGRL